MKLKRKGAIELSANFIVVIIISLIIVVGGLTMFFKMKNNAQSYVDALDSQTEDRIKSMMLSGTDRVAVYPIDFTIGSNDAKMVGVGITNIHSGPNPTLFKVEITNVQMYTDIKAVPEGTPVVKSLLVPPSKYYDMTPNALSINPHDQKVKGILIKIPKGSIKGQYVYTLNVTADKSDGSGYNEYGILQVFANVK